MGDIENEHNDYYVYGHIRPDNNTYYYIGKGRERRAYLKSRNQLHDEVMNKYGLKIEIIKDNLTEEEAYQEEYNVINKLINEQGYGIDINGLRGNNKNKFLTNKTFGSQGSIGISNPQYGVSPKERLKENYHRWRETLNIRLKAQVKDKNPNWNNHTLHNKVKDKPELRIQYYSRKGSQNGRCRKIALYDSNWSWLEDFDYIGKCALRVNELTDSNANINGVRSNIEHAIKYNKQYKGFNFKYID